MSSSSLSTRPGSARTERHGSNALMQHSTLLLRSFLRVPSRQHIPNTRQVVNPFVEEEIKFDATHIERSAGTSSGLLFDVHEDGMRLVADSNTGVMFSADVSAVQHVGLGTIDGSELI